MIVIKDVHKSFGDNHVLNGIDLHIPRGETLVIMGRSGCGKSVLLKLISGLIAPDQGEIDFDNEDIAKMDRKKLNKIRHRIGFLFQSAALFDFMTVFENVSFMLTQHQKLKKSEIRKIVAEKLEMVDLPAIEDLKPAELSGGMRKRVGLARAIAADPKVILYDEPTTGLDPITCIEINDLIKNLHAKMNATSVVVTHDMESAFSVGTRMAMLHDGKVIAHGTPEEIENSDDPRVQSFIYQRFKS